jgi:oligogalacturonide lyase
MGVPMKLARIASVLLLSMVGVTAQPVVVSEARRVEPVMVTVTNTGNNQLLYFTSSSLTADDKHLVFISDRTGNPNLFTRNLITGEDRQLTTNTEGVLKAYVYFDGTPYRGFGKGSVSLDAQNEIVYFIQGREIRSVTLDGRQRGLAMLPANQMTAFTHVSADGKRLCVPTTDSRALDGDRQLKGKPDYDIDQRVQREHLVSYLRVFDTTTGKQIACEPVTNAWITHVQFSPVHPNLVLYNHEWCSESGIRRMWLWDGKRHIRLRTEGNGRSRNDWTCHEMWERDGSAIIYHGNFTNGVNYVGRVLPDGSGRVEISLPANWKRYGHFTVGKPGELVSDGCYEAAGDPGGWAGSWIALLKVNWDAHLIEWCPITRSGTSWKSQDEHPHPVFNHAADAVFFTSDKTGKRAIYRVTVPEKP